MTNMEDHCDSTYWNKSNLTIIFSISILEEQNTKTKTDAAVGENRQSNAAAAVGGGVKYKLFVTY